MITKYFFSYVFNNLLDNIRSVMLSVKIETDAPKQTLLYPQAEQPFTQSLFKVGVTIRGS